MKFIFSFVFILTTLFSAAQSTSKTWYVRADGGTRYSANVTTGQCNGKADVAYPGSGVNQPCAFNDFRYMWDDHSGSVGMGAWVMAGGDTVLIRGCKAFNPSTTPAYKQDNPDDPHCRLGWDRPYGDSLNPWCYGVGSYTCYNPPIPAGTAAQHTRILGQNYTNCNVGGSNYPKDYVSNLTQLFGGFSQTWSFDLGHTSYVDVQCIELTTHNGKCTTSGTPAYPKQCSNNQPLDDFAGNGFKTDNLSSNITLQDVYVHGFNSSGLSGPIGAGNFTMTRVAVNWNGFAGWNFSDASNTPNATGANSVNSYVTLIGNGCYEEYPIVHSTFPAQACYDDASNGFGDAWSGQDTNWNQFICDHCVMQYNTKDAFIGPHANPALLKITNSFSGDNMGAQWKWNNAPGGTVYFASNITRNGCARMSELIPGAAHTFDQGSGLSGAYLSHYCRAGGNSIAINTQANSTVLFTNSTFVDDSAVVLYMSCGAQGHDQDGSCGASTVTWQNNIDLGYTLGGSTAPGQFYINDSSVHLTQNHNVYFGVVTTFGTTLQCGSNGNKCADPLLTVEPAQSVTTHTALDTFNFAPTVSSPAKGAGVVVSGLSTDYNGFALATPPSIGALEYGSVLTTIINTIFGTSLNFTNIPH